MMDTPQSYQRRVTTGWTQDHRVALASLTPHPVAEGVPGLTQVFTGAVVHYAHVSKATEGIGVGGGVGHPGLVQPASSTHIHPALQRTAGPGSETCARDQRGELCVVFTHLLSVGQLGVGGQAASQRGTGLLSCTEVQFVLTLT